MNTKAAFAIVSDWVSGLTNLFAGFVGLSVLGEIILGHSSIRRISCRQPCFTGWTIR